MPTVGEMRLQQARETARKNALLDPEKRAEFIEAEKKAKELEKRMKEVYRDLQRIG